MQHLRGVTGYVQPMGGAEFIVEEGTAANTSLLVHTFAATDVSGGAVSWSVGEQTQQFLKLMRMER